MACSIQAALAAEEVEDLDPDARGVRMLQMINAYRADPAGQARLMLQVHPMLIPGLGHELDVEMFLAEMAKITPVHPLLHDPQLTKSARAHANYLKIHAAVQHHEEPDQRGFTGLRPPHRAQAAGWTSPVVGENCAGPAVDPWCAHISFIIDWTHGSKPGTGGMQLGRGHRMSLSSPRFTRVGLGNLPDPAKRGRLWVVQNFGLPIKETRRAGGVVFVDRNRDGWCDAGEGVAGATVQVLDSEGAEVAAVITQPTGHWLVAVPGEDTRLLRITRIVGRKEEVVEERELPDAITSWTDTRLAEPRDLMTYKVTMARVPAEGSTRRRALVGLLSLGDRLPLAGDAAAAYAAAREELGKADPQLLPLLDGFEARYRTGDHAALRRDAAALGRRYTGTALASWAKDAALLLDSYEGAYAVHDMAVTGRRVTLSTMAKMERAAQVGKAIAWPSLRLLYRDVERAMATLGKEIK